MAMTTWDALAVLPNISLRKGNEIGCDIAALVSAEDDRVKEIFNRQPKLEVFLERFSDQLGNVFSEQDGGRDMPALLICKTEHFEAVSKNAAAAALRDVIAVSVICSNRVGKLNDPSQTSPAYSDVFAFYPYMLSAEGERVTIWTPALGNNGHAPETFYPQSDPSIARYIISPSDAPKQLVQAMLASWKRTFMSPALDRDDVKYRDNVKCMRSLNMAFHALKQPGRQETTLYDWGRLSGLWVSAFEILANQDKQSGRRDVVDLIDSFKWDTYEYDTDQGHRTDTTLTDKNYIEPNGDDENARKKPKPCSLPGYLYLCINKTRNDFLHGNDVTDETLHLSMPAGMQEKDAGTASSIPYANFAPALYLAAQMAHLGLSPPKEDQPEDTTEGIAKGAIQTMRDSDLDTPLREALRKALPFLEDKISK